MKRKRIGKQIIDDLSGLVKRSEAEMPKREVIEKCACGNAAEIHNRVVCCSRVSCVWWISSPSRAESIAAWDVVMKSFRTKAVKRA